MRSKAVVSAGNKKTGRPEESRLPVWVPLILPKPIQSNFVQYKWGEMDSKNGLMTITQALVETDRQMLSENFEAVVRAHQQRIFRILMMLLRDQDEADALTQECFLRAYSRRAGFRGESAVGTWLVRIAVNLARDQLKSRRSAFWRRLLRGKGLEAQTVADVRRSPEDAVAARERAAAIWTIVERLPVQQRTVFTLRFAEEMQIGEIAQAMKLREGTVKAHLSSAVQAVRKEMRD
jgi:RNA polymerase sigma-70 factor (ECF subfamily)